MSPTLAGRFFTTEPPGKLHISISTVLTCLLNLEPIVMIMTFKLSVCCHAIELQKVRKTQIYLNNLDF